MYRNLLVPVEPTGCSREVSIHASQLAAAFGARVHLLHVLAPPAGVHMDDRHLGRPVREVLAEESDKALDGLAALFAEGVEVRRVRREGDVATAILQAAREVGADLIVMGTHGRTGLRRLLMGSVAEAVLRQAGVPCFVVHAPVGTSDALSPAQQEVAADLDG